MPKQSTIHVYVRYGHDELGEYTEKIYSPFLVPEDDNLEYIGETTISKVDFNEDTRTYI